MVNSNGSLAVEVPLVFKAVSIARTHQVHTSAKERRMTMNHRKNEPSAPSTISTINHQRHNHQRYQG
jgi:hypothetical protein